MPVEGAPPATAASLAKTHYPPAIRCSQPLHWGSAAERPPAAGGVSKRQACGAVLLLTDALLALSTIPQRREGEWGALGSGAAGMARGCAPCRDAAGARGVGATSKRHPPPVAAAFTPALPAGIGPAGGAAPEEVGAVVSGGACACPAAAAAMLALLPKRRGEAVRMLLLQTPPLLLTL
eukprot:385966-Pelagomonas_calceolata.AAC.1